MKGDVSERDAMLMLNNYPFFILVIDSYQVIFINSYVRFLYLIDYLVERIAIINYVCSVGLYLALRLPWRLSL